MSWKRAVGVLIGGVCCAGASMAGVSDRLNTSNVGQLQAATTVDNQLSAQADASRATSRAACNNNVWNNGYGQASGNLHSSQLDSVYPFDSQTADDFQLEFSINIDGVEWRGGYWNGGTPPFEPGFKIMFYADNGNQPTGGPTDPTGTALAVYTFTFADAHQSQPGAGLYDYSVTLSPPFNVGANTHYWVAVQAVINYPPQWGWAGHETGTLPLIGAQLGFPLLGTDYWAPISPRADMDFCLTVSMATTGACCWDEGQTPPSAPFCQDGYLEFFCTQQGGRFSIFHQCNAGGPLPQIDPACGDANGACCKPDGTCTLVKASQCPPTTGLWLGYLSTCDECPCIFVPNCPPGGISETEACGAHTNDGCSTTPYQFSVLPCGDTVCGSIYADAAMSPTRDQDWWKLVLNQPYTVTFTLKSEFPMFMGFAVFPTDGDPDCANYSGYIGPYQATTDNDENCNGLSVAKRCEAGTYYIVVQPYVADGYPCIPGTYNNYIGMLSCEATTLDCESHALYSNQTTALWDFDGGTGSSQITSSWHSQIADDFTLAGSGVKHVGTVKWAGGYWNPGQGTPTAFNIYFYNDAGGMPTRDPNDPNAGDPAASAIAAYNLTLANANELAISLGHGGGTAAYTASLTPAFNATAGTRYWIGIQAAMEYPPQWGWAYHNTVIGNPHVQGFPDLAMDYWTVQTGDTNFCLDVPPFGPLCPVTGDINGDWVVDNFDINAFVYALAHTWQQFHEQYPDGSYWCADLNCDLVVDNFDINAFVKCLTHDPSCRPCP